MTNTTETVTSVSPYTPIINQLLEMNRNFKATATYDILVTMAKWKRAKEAQTIHVGGYRQTGKTQWIRENAKPNWVIIVVNKAEQEELLNHWFLRDLPSPYVFTASDIRLMHVRGEKCKITDIECVVIDEVEYVRRHVPTDIIYRWLEDVITESIDFVAIN